MNKYVLTGGASCGKTTLINELRQKGFSVLEEVARQVIEKRQHIPLSKEEWETRQQLIFQQQIQEEENLQETAFLDRGIIDVIIYSNHFLGYIPDSIEMPRTRNRYSKVFVLGMLPFEDDGLRVEAGHEEAEQIHNKIIAGYKEHGYNPTVVPAFPGDKEQAIQQRLNYILERTENGAY